MCGSIVRHGWAPWGHYAHEIDCKRILWTNCEIIYADTYILVENDAFAYRTRYDWAQLQAAVARATDPSRSYDANVFL